MDVKKTQARSWVRAQREIECAVAKIRSGPVDERTKWVWLGWAEMKEGGQASSRAVAVKKGHRYLREVSRYLEVPCPGLPV